jgi:AcrR family transcriptional regulator
VARVRTEEKRQEIVRVACELFEQYGFDRTSMSMISDRLGGSKATLYGYFKSKDELFRAVVDHDIPEQSERFMQEFLSGKNLREGLTKLGIAYLTRLLSPTPIANMRMLANQPEDSTMPKAFWDSTLRPAWQRLTDRIEAMMDEGLLKRADPWVATMHWKGLNEWDLLDRRLLGISKEIDPAEIGKAATTAADAFLTLYGANGHTAGTKMTKTGPMNARRKAPARKKA